MNKNQFKPDYHRFQMETSAQSVHDNLNGIVDYQTHHRLREAQVCQFRNIVTLHLNSDIYFIGTYTAFAPLDSAVSFQTPVAMQDSDVLPN